MLQAEGLPLTKVHACYYWPETWCNDATGLLLLPWNYEISLCKREANIDYTCSIIESLLGRESVSEPMRTAGPLVWCIVFKTGPCWEPVKVRAHEFMD